MLLAYISTINAAPYNRTTLQIEQHRHASSKEDLLLQEHIIQSLQTVTIIESPRHQAPPASENDTPLSSLVAGFWSDLLTSRSNHQHNDTAPRLFPNTSSLSACNVHSFQDPKKQQWSSLHGVPPLIIATYIVSLTFGGWVGYRWAHYIYIHKHGGFTLYKNISYVSRPHFLSIHESMLWCSPSELSFASNLSDLDPARTDIIAFTLCLITVSALARFHRTSLRVKIFRCFPVSKTHTGTGC